ncbi:MAG: pyridoxamine 5'-phosphate oxidase family protein [archaeon]
MITEAIKNLFESQDLVVVATTSADGTPNAVPIYWKKIVDEKTIWFADNFMKKTAENVQANPKCCVSFWDAKTEESYKLVGTATYHSGDEKHLECIKWLQSINPAKNPKGLVEFVVEEVYNLMPGENAGKKIE